MAIDCLLFETPTPEGPMAVEVFGSGVRERRSAVILYMDARGVRDELREMCARIEQAGYVVFLPDLYHRLGRQIGFPSESSTGEKSEIETIIAHIKSVTIAGALMDTRSLMSAVDAAPDLEIDRWGAVGYCMGGPLAFAAAGEFPTRVAAAASFYGVGCMTAADDSPHRKAGDIRAELYFCYAEHDHLAPPSEIPPLHEHLAAAGVTHTIDVYAGVSHGFAFPRRSAYDQGASERHWASMLALFDRTLR